LSVSDDGRFLLFRAASGASGLDLWLLSLGDRKAFPFANSKEAEPTGQISPRSKWIAYVALGAGGPELFVRPFPKAFSEGAGADGSRWPVAVGVVPAIPRWSPDGRQLVYVTQNADMLAVDVEDGVAFRTMGPARRLFALVGPAAWARDPKMPRILVPQPETSSGPPPPFTLLLNWIPQLER
jgi:hypothetical protein